MFIIGFGLLVYFLLPLLRDTRDLISKLRLAAEELEEDYETLKDKVEEEGAKTKAIADVLLGFASRALSITPPHKRKKRKRGASAK